MRITTICAMALLAGSAGALEITGVYDVDVASGASQTISEAITGSGSIRKTGAGTLVLSGANTFTGGPASARVSPLISGTGVLRVAKGPVGFQIIFR